MKGKSNIIKFQEVEKGSDYANVTSPFFRTNAAIVIERFIRQQWLAKHDKWELVEKLSNQYTDKAVLVEYYINASMHKEDLPFLKEPSQESEISEFLNHLASKVSSENYHELNFNHPDFNRLIFLALRKNQINAKQLLTIKLLYEAQMAFNEMDIAITAADDKNTLRRHSIKENNNSPFSPFEIVYVKTKEKKRIIENLRKEKSFEPHYYTIDFLKVQEVFLLTSVLEQGYMASWALPYFDAYCNKHFSADKGNDLDAFLAKIKNYDKKDKEWLINQLQKSAPDITFDSKDNEKHKDSMKFLVSIKNVNSKIPSIAISPLHHKDDEKTVSFCFVIPTTETIEFLQEAIFENEAVYLQPVLGQETTKMIRAMDEVPFATNTNQSSEVVDLLKTLYPSAKNLEKPSRPIEITHPDVAKTDYPHGYDCYDFLLTWHDVFHAWRSSENYKNIIRHLRHVFDDRGGIANKKSGMSKSIWQLTDIDFSAGWVARANGLLGQPNLFNYLTGLVNIFERVGFDFNFNARNDTNLLLLYDMAKNKDQWCVFLNGIEPEDLIIQLYYLKSDGLLDGLYLFEKEHVLSLLSQIKRSDSLDELSKVSDELIKKYGDRFSSQFFKKILSLSLQLKKTEILIKTNKKASFCEIYLRSLLLDKEYDITQLYAFMQDKYQDLFYFSENSGVYFSQQARNHLKLFRFHFLSHVSDNTSDNIVKALLALNYSNHWIYFNRDMNALFLKLYFDNLIGSVINKIQSIDLKKYDKKMLMSAFEMADDAFQLVFKKSNNRLNQFIDDENGLFVELYKNTNDWGFLSMLFVETFGFDFNDIGEIVKSKLNFNFSADEVEAIKKAIYYYRFDHFGESDKNGEFCFSSEVQKNLFDGFPFKMHGKINENKQELLMLFVLFVHRGFLNDSLSEKIHTLIVKTYINELSVQLTKINSTFKSINLDFVLELIDDDFLFNGYRGSPAKMLNNKDELLKFIFVHAADVDIKIKAFNQLKGDDVHSLKELNRSSIKEICYLLYIQFDRPSVDSKSNSASQQTSLEIMRQSLDFLKEYFSIGTDVENLYLLYQKIYHCLSGYYSNSPSSYMSKSDVNQLMCLQQVFIDDVKNILAKDFEMHQPLLKLMQIPTSFINYSPAEQDRLSASFGLINRSGSSKIHTVLNEIIANYSNEKPNIAVAVV